MKVLLSVYFLFCISLVSDSMAQSSPYLDNSYTKVENTTGVRVMPIAPANSAQPRGFHFDGNTLQNNQNFGSGYLNYVRNQNILRCGTNLQLKPYARYEDDTWQGIDADFCKAIALAILGNSEKIEMVNVEASNVAQSLASRRIDVMLSGVPFKALQEISGDVENAGLLYYDQQLLMVADDDKEPEYYRGKKICLATGSDYYRNFEEFNMQHNLEISYLTFPDMSKVQEAFLLKRCQMVTAGALFLSGMKQSLLRSKAKIYPDKIAITPVYALVSAQNREMRLAVKWILNALLLAEQYDINARNLNFFASHNNPEIRNLMGDDPKLWESLGLRPFWINDAIKLLGNYGEIYDRNIGEESEYNIDRGEGHLIRDGGTVYPLPFM